MNKSKFLKKSLAALLAVVLVVAMIPLSAAAADAPVVDKVTVNDQPATLSGDTWTAELTGSPTSAPEIKVTLHNGIGYVAHDGADVTEDVDGTFTFDMTNDEFESENHTATFLVYADGETTTPTHTYKVTYTVKNGAEEVGVKSVTASGQYGSTSREGTTYTITLPYGTSNLLTNAITVVLDDPNASISTVAGGPTSATPVTGKKGSFTLTGATSDITKDITFTVVAEDGVHTQDYTIKLQVAGAFKSFSVDGERKAAKIDTTDSTDKKIEVYMPYDTKVDANKKWQFTPRFEMEYASVKVKATKVTSGTPTVEIKSGEKIELADFVAATNPSDDVDATNNGCTITLTVEYTNSASETWTLNFNTPKNDPEPVLKGLRVANYAGVINETAKTVTLTLPASKRIAGQDVMLLASAGSKILPVQVSGVSEAIITGDWDSGDKLTLDLSKDEYRLRVTAAGDEDGVANDDPDVGTVKTEDYTLFIKSTQDVQPSIDEFKLEDPNGNQYKATIGTDGTILFNLPYSFTKSDTGAYTVVDGKDDLNNWKLYYALSEGSGCTALASIPSGTKLGASESIMPTAFDGKTADGTALEVTIDDKTYKTYKVAIKSDNPSTTTTLGNFKITQLDGNSSGQKFTDIKDGENAFTATGTTNMTVAVPHSKYISGSYAAGSFVSATLPAGAKLYYFDKTTKKVTELSVLDKYTSAALTVKLPRIANSSAAATDGYLYDGVTPGADGKPVPLDLVVVSEAGAKYASDNSVTVADVTKADLATSFGRGGYSLYTLTVKKDDPKTTAHLDSFNVYDATTKTTIEGKVTQSPTGITLTLPYGFDDTVATASIVNELYLDWSSKNYETITLKQTDGAGGYTDLTDTAFEKVTFDSEGEVDEGTVIDALSAGPSIQEAANDEDIICVEVADEAGTKTVSYPVTVKFEKEKTDAKLTRVTIGNRSGTPDANNKVTITMPKATEITALKPNFIVSDGAFVSTASTNGKNSVLESGTQMNFTAPQTVYVYSENARNMTAYTIEVKVDDGFSDVKTTDWFYKYVMEAADRGIVIGNPDGTFNPMGPVTRVQFATMMARVDKFNAAEWEGKSSQFSDMGSISGEAAAAVAYCADKGYITGDGGTTNFRPNDRISRQEMAVIITRVLKLDTSNVNSDFTFRDDASISSWAKEYVYACYEAKMLLGEGNNTFNPKANTIRAAAATAAIRVQDEKAK